MSERSTKTIMLDESPAFLRFIGNDCKRGDPSSSNDLVVSTYQLSQTNSGARTGSILLLSSKEGAVKRRIEMNGGVFRFEIIPDNNHILTALTSGRLSLVDLVKDKQNMSDILTGGIILNASWNKKASKVICSDDYGELILLNGKTFQVQERWLAHKSNFGLTVCEVWSCCWMNNTENICASGAEDGNLKVWDVRADFTHPQAVNKKSHEAGVTFVGALSANSDHQLFTGSYDEYVRLFDIRNITQSLQEHKLTGGVWHMERMAVNDDDEELYLASCMYGGWCLLAKSAASRFAILRQKRLGAECLLYGISALRLNDANYRIATSTFNDKCVHICDLHTNRDTPRANHV